MNKELPEEQEKISEDKIERKKSLLKKARGKLAAFMTAGMVLYGSGLPGKETVSLEEEMDGQVELYEAKLREKIGGDAVESLQAIFSAKVTEGSIENDLDRNISLTDVPSADGVLHAKDLNKYISYFPESWSGEEVKRIQYSGKLYDKDEGAIASCWDVERRAEIEIYQTINGVKLAEIIYILNHEIAHANDFINDNNLTYSERLELAVRIYERATSEDRYKSDYLYIVRFWENKLALIREYWAEISSVYFTNPTALAIEDFKIVDYVVRKSSPNFDLVKLRESGAELLKKHGK